MPENVIQEYADILKMYMDKFGLEIVDIVFLSKSTNKNNITALLEYSGGITLETQETIARIFDLRYFEFGNPNYPLPSFESLPDTTKARIALRKKEGPPIEKSYKTSDINERIAEILTNYKVGDEFLAAEIVNSILEKYEETYSVSEIIDRFKKTFKENIEKTDKKDTSRKVRGPKPVFYRLVVNIK